MATRLFVGNLPDNTSENDLRSAFSSYGTITTLDLKTKTGTGTGNESKKFAFVSISGSNYDIEACEYNSLNPTYFHTFIIFLHPKLPRILWNILI